MQRKIPLFCYFLIINLSIFSQPTEPHLSGLVTIDSLLKEPYSTWYQKYESEYIPNKSVIKKIENLNLQDYSMEIFFGSWCGDSKRELPRMMRILHEINFPITNIEFIAVDRADSVYKQSPTHEEQGKYVYRVPTFIVYKNNSEVNRIVEYPDESLERDLLKILVGKEYVPSYASYPILMQWFEEGILQDANVSYYGLADDLKNIVGSAGELNAAGYVYIALDELQSAVKIFNINCVLFADEYNPYWSLGEAYLIIKDKENAIKYLTKSIELIDEKENLSDLLKMLDDANKL